MKENIRNRVVLEAVYMIETKKTLREIAHDFKVSKSTVHKDLHERLIKVDKRLNDGIKDILKDHIDRRHIRGGESTKMKYLKHK